MIFRVIFGNKLLSQYIEGSSDGCCKRTSELNKDAESLDTFNYKQFTHYWLTIYFESNKFEKKTMLSLL